MGAMTGRLEGKTALVIGAGTAGGGWGNGKAAAVLFAREGARVFAVDRHPAAAEETRRIIEGEGGSCTAHRADVTNAVEVAAMVAACVGAFWADRRAAQQCRRFRSRRTGRDGRGDLGCLARTSI